MKPDMDEIGAARASKSALSNTALNLSIRHPRSWPASGQLLVVESESESQNPGSRVGAVVSYVYK